MPADSREWNGIRTDLAIEAHDHVRGAEEKVPGVKVDTEERGEITITRVTVSDEDAAARIGKPAGRYITIEAAGLRERNHDLQEAVARAVADEMRRLVDLDEDTKTFVVGLGNWNATPDALGPKVIDQLLVTRHLREYVPNDLAGDLASVCAVAPGVLGLTGIETSEIIQGVIDRVKPDVVIAVDALASRSIDRIMTTIQIADTGIVPGSGVGNDRKELTPASLGIPVIGIGVPTVVHAMTIAMDTVNMLIEELQNQNSIYKALGSMSPDEKQQMIDATLSPVIGKLMVTPKEIDVQIEDMAGVVAGGLNGALHPGVAKEETLIP